MQSRQQARDAQAGSTLRDHHLAERTQLSVLKRHAAGVIETASITADPYASIVLAADNAIAVLMADTVTATGALVAAVSLASPPYCTQSTWFPTPGAGSVNVSEPALTVAAPRVVCCVCPFAE
jgi:hypothetical protein